ncbi:MAG: peptide deformylase [Ignavibacteria bacterium]|nr:peptide deformylase [Ignavibacteria bacterium]
MRRQIPITTFGMPVLRKKTKAVTKIDTRLINLVENMFYTMDKAAGIGLAAPQINLDISLAVVDISGYEKNNKEKPMVLINPEILGSHGEVEMEEGCLSIPEIRADVTRPGKIFLKYHDFDLNEVTVELNGFISRVIQHEIDHLNGKLFIDYLPEEKKKEIKKQLAKIKKGKVITDYPLLIHSGD